VSKSGEIKETNIKNFDVETLYKKAGYKTGDGFIKQTEWGLEVLDTQYNIEIYAKTSGRAGQENKYEFPPPVDTTLFFGTVILINMVDGIPVDLFQEEWSKIYETLYGGFEDIGDSDEDEDEDEDGEGDEIPKTKEGYAKDGFIVDDDDADEDYTEPESEEDTMTDSSEDDKPKTKKSVASAASVSAVATKKSVSAVATKKSVSAAKKSVEPLENLCKTRNIQKRKKVEKSEPINNGSYLNCDSELEVEEYA